MTNRTQIIIATSAIVVFAATVGFFITLEVSPQIAYARLFIDAGLIIGLVAVVMAFHREKELPLKGLTHALKNLKEGNYKNRISEDDLGQLSEIAKGINELAMVLASNHEKQEEIKRNLREELLPAFKPKEVKEIVKELKEPLTEKEHLYHSHSHHPELGPVITIAPLERQSLKPEPMPMTSFGSLSNTFIDSVPPKIAKDDFLNQDMGELYERFIEAQRELNLEKIEYHLFLKTIESTRQELMASHQCHGIMFDIVAKAEEVALQPKIIR